MQEVQEKFDVNTKTLIGASGKKYIVRHTVNADEFKILEELRIEIDCGNSAADLVKLQAKAVGYLQKNDVYNASIALYNATNISERIMEGREAAWLLALTLFAKPEGFTGKWNEAEANEWIADWSTYTAHDLFTLAVTCKTEFDLGFLRSSLDILDRASASGSASDLSDVPEDGQKSQQETA